MNLYFDKKRIAFVVLSLLSCLFALICVFSNGWSTYDGEQFGLFSPDIASNNVCGRLAKNDEKCLHWFRAAQALMVLCLLSHIVTIVGLVLAEKKDKKFLIAGLGQFSVGVFCILGLLVYSYQSPYANDVKGYDLGWSFKLAWSICFFSLVSAVLGITDGTRGEGIKL